MRKTIPITLLVIGLALLYPMQRWIDAKSSIEVVNDESLYFSSGQTIKKLSVGLHAIVADIYWIRTVQYFGNKLRLDGTLTADTRNIRMDLLAPLLKIIVTLDPGHIPAYRFGAIFLPERDLPAAIELLTSGIRDNPTEWRLFQDLGYIYWQSGDYATASEWYEKGGAIAESAWWMGDMGALLKLRGGSREVARRIYTQYLESEDSNIRNQAAERLKQIQLLDELDAINGILERYRKETGSCPQRLRSLAPRLRSMGMTLDQELNPVDPNGFPYVFDVTKCVVDRSPDSTVAR